MRTEPDERPHPAATGPTGVSHERSDVRPRPVLLFVFWLLVAAVVIHVGLWGLFRLFAAESRRGQRPVAGDVARNLRRTPAAPRLEALPLAPRRALNAAEEETLSGYGWVDRTTGIARIPIDEAMRRIAERGVPGGKPMPVLQAPGAAAPGAMAPGPGRRETGDGRRKTEEGRGQKPGGAP